MKSILRRLRPSPAMVVACTALLFAMTGAGYAAGVVGPNSVGPKQLKKNSVTSAKVKNRSLLAVDFKAGQLPQGPKGDPGAPGAPGAAGAPGQQGPAGPGAQWATVSGAGAILRQSGGITAAKVQTGGYRVTFPEAVTGHLILVTPALAGDQTTRGIAIAGPCQDFAASCGAANIPNSVSVFTLSTTGTQQDHSFTVAQMGPNATTAFVPQTRAMRSAGSALSK
jgi:hypothetical protein